VYRASHDLPGDHGAVYAAFDPSETAPTVNGLSIAKEPHH
jgi:hypothetical protein